MTDRAAYELGIHVVCPDRPGIGRSDFVPERKIVDWPATVTKLADACGWDHFSVLGVSGGGPYARVCAYALGKRVRKAVVVCGVPHYRWIEDSTEIRSDLRRAHRFVSSHQARARRVFGLLRICVGIFPSQLLLRLMLPMVKEPDRSAITTPDRLTQMAEGAREAFAGTAEGLALDLSLLTTDWGFGPADISKPIHFWHGDRDQICPLTDLYENLKGVSHHRVTAVPGEGHYSLPINHNRAILESAV